MTNQQDLFQIKGKTAVISGGAGHIASEYCRLFSEQGGRCVILDNNEDRIAKLISNLKVSEVGSHVGYTLDLSDANDIERCLNKFIDKHSSIDILVNNAAFTGDAKIQGWVTDFASQSLDVWNDALLVNLTSYFLLSQYLAPLLKNGSNPSILNISSIYGMLGPDMKIYKDTSMGNPAAYAASKGGVIQLTRWLATVLAPEIRVNCISAGGIARNQDAKFVDRYIAKVPIGRMGSESDIAKSMLFLTSNLSSYITGQNLTVDGGYSTW